ncbi:hypothetical protein [Aeromonas bivalvium]|uniref:hypothetical protein n=1 Tax=Aeromonas bivalvium TaxID=440079 RepID=UPI0038D057B1
MPDGGAFIGASLARQIRIMGLHHDVYMGTDDNSWRSAARAGEASAGNVAREGLRGLDT